MEYRVTIEELLHRDIRVQAQSKREAEDIVRKLYRDVTIVLDSGDFAYVDFKTDTIEDPTTNDL